MASSRSRGLGGLSPQDREYFRLVHVKHLEQTVAWKMVNPGKKWASHKSLGVVASQAMTRIIERIDLDGFLKARGLDDDALAKILVDAAHAKKVQIGADGVVYSTKDHAIRLKALDRVVEIRYGKPNEAGEQATENHLHIHLPGKADKDEEWENESALQLLKLDKTGTQQSGKG